MLVFRGGGGGSRTGGCFFGKRGGFQFEHSCRFLFDHLAKFDSQDDLKQPLKFENILRGNRTCSNFNTSIAGVQLCFEVGIVPF